MQEGERNMHENQDVNIISRDNINSLIQLCLQTEQDRGLSKNSIVELKRYLNDFSTYCECQNIYSVNDLTPLFLKDYIDQRCADMWVGIEIRRA